MQEDLKQKLSSLAAHINKIEGRLKSVENIRQEVVIAAINELRYAGRRFVDAWALCIKENPTEDDEKLIGEHFVIARQYLTNADHDLTDAVCIYVHGQITSIQAKYGVDEIVKFDPDFVAFARRMNEANSIVTGSRETRAERDAAYKNLEENYISELISKHETLKFAEGLALADQKKKAFRSKIINYIGLFSCLIGIPGTIVGVIGWDGAVKLPIVSSLFAQPGDAVITQSPAKLPVFTMPSSGAPPFP